MNWPNSDVYSPYTRTSVQESNIMTQLKTELGRGIVLVLLDREFALYDVQTFHFSVAITEAFDYFLHSFRTPIDF